LHFGVGKLAYMSAASSVTPYKLKGKEQNRTRYFINVEAKYFVGL